MLKKLISKMVGEAISQQTGKPDMSARLAELEKENSDLKAKLENSGASKRLAKIKAMAAAVPAGAQGMGMIAVIENGVAKNIELKSKADLEAVIARAETGEVEILLS